MFNHETLRQAITDAGSHFVSVRFIKADGSERQMTINPRQFLEIKGTGKPASDPNIFRVVDAKLGAWRSFDARRVISIKVSGEVFTSDS
jgi:hypothetical protein